MLAPYDTEWMLGNLSGLMSMISRNGAEDQLGKLSSPLRQLFFLGGLLMPTNPKYANDAHYDHETWDKVLELLNEIELQY